MSSFHGITEAHLAQLQVRYNCTDTQRIFEMLAVWLSLWPMAPNNVQEVIISGAQESSNRGYHPPCIQLEEHSGPANLSLFLSHFLSLSLAVQRFKHIQVLVVVVALSGIRHFIMPHPDVRSSVLQADTPSFRSFWTMLNHASIERRKLSSVWLWFCDQPEVYYIAKWFSDWFVASWPFGLTWN